MSRRPEPLPDPPAFFLEDPPDGESARLVSEDADHARRVLRLGPGERCLGLDGAGGRWPLVVRAVDRGRLEVEVRGPAIVEPGPGAEGATLPWVELAIAWPRKQRGEDLIGALVQLGAAAITPLEARYRGPEPCPETPPDRWWRLARAACKQARRSWLPVLGATRTLADLLAERAAASIAFLDPRAGLPLDAWLRSILASPLGLGTAERPVVLVVGPEGGFAPEEREALLSAGASATWIGPHVLRVETAAAAAMALAATILGSPERPS